MNVAHFCIPASSLRSIPSTGLSDGIFCHGDHLVLRVRFPGGESPVFLHFKAIDFTHWEEIGSEALSVFHSMQLGDFINRLSDDGSLLGIRLSTDGQVTFQIGNFQ